MEVREEGIDDPEGVTGTDEEVGFAVRDGAGAAEGVLEGADDGGAGGDDAPALGTSAGDGVGGGGREAEALGGEDVRGGVLGADGTEGSGADLQREEGTLDTGRVQPREEVGGEVEAGGGGSGAARIAGVDGLVAVGVAVVVVDVGREGDGADGGGIDGAVKGDGDAFIVAVAHGGGEGAVAGVEAELAAGGGGAAGTDQG